MAIKEYLNTHHVFSSREFEAAFPGSQTDRKLLSRAVKNGKAELVRGGLYISRAERYRDETVNRFDIARALADDATLCYLSALEVQGILHNAVAQVQFYSNYRVSRLEYSGSVYLRYSYPKEGMEKETVSLEGGKRYCVTTLEQTIVDCLFAVDRAGGLENTLHSFAAIEYLDKDRLLQIAKRQTKSVIARLGWVLSQKQSQWYIEASEMDELQELLGRGPYYFDKTSKLTTNWNSRWRMYLPHEESTMIDWINS